MHLLITLEYQENEIKTSLYNCVLIRHQSSSCHWTMKAFWGILFMCVLAQGLRDEGKNYLE